MITCRNRQTLASDNFASTHPKILEALIEANQGHARAYGYDELTAKATARFCEIFESEVQTYFVFNGTGANVLALGACTKRFGAVLCPASAHINVDECGAPEWQLGIKLLPIATPEGKLLPAQITPHLHAMDSEHHSRPCAISISQSSELGTLYSTGEIAALAEVAHQHGLYLHVDGARIANSVAASNTSLKKMLVETHVDVISFGGTKNGMMYGEAVVFLNKSLGQEIKFMRKQSMQLASKMRFISAQFLALFEDELWLKNAAHANKMAKLLQQKLETRQNLKIIYPVEANAVFVQMPKTLIHTLKQELFFWTWDEEQNIARLMTSFDTTPEELHHFVSKCE
ncbi:MAG: low specificity L-threonine aldolase [Oligoflexia bacterium]|nr:low specificity L-threonine aldolase [Oligoflexia bacterium]